ncbi:MAG: excinuclease ABC subunit UvrB [Bacteroidales bacterium]|nr:excinuclease ABC subunit UvrB [Bacteroidales bacterium]
MGFNLVSDFKPTGDQPEAISGLLEGIRRGEKYQVLLGVTGSGKTFTVANVLSQLNEPVLVLSHNKTLAAQLYGEFKQFFPDNAVEYFVSYYDYYQPEAYLPVTDTYIEKDLVINDEIEKLRLSTTTALLSGRNDVIVVSSVSCIYGIGNPDDFKNNVIRLKKAQLISRQSFLHSLVDAMYSRSEGEFQRGNFRVRGDTVDIFPAYADTAYRVVFWGDEIEEMFSMEASTGEILNYHDNIVIFPANIFNTSRDKMNMAIREIQDDLQLQITRFKEAGKEFEAKRIEERVNYDIEMMKELGYCPGIENYSRYFDGRSPGMRPFCLLDYFPDNFLMIIDESHVTLPQIRGMYGGDFSRKTNLVEYGFRLPAALDNRPLKFDEFENVVDKVIYVSATPADYELTKTQGTITEQVIRPTGLLDPVIEIRPSLNQIDDLMDEISKRVAVNERVLVTTLTKRMAEELSKYLTKFSIRCRYIHSEVDTLERVEILRDLRMGVFDVLIGVNLLREGLDLPEVSLVAILDADKEGFLRSERSLTQTAGRAARNINSLVIMYADKITGSMQRTIDETNRRRLKQIDYNIKNNITPRQIIKSKESIFGQTAVVNNNNAFYSENEHIDYAADPVVQYMTTDQLKKAVQKVRKLMEQAAKELNLVEAARLRDEMFALKKLLDEKS